MTAAQHVKVVAGYDGSLVAGAAIDAAARLMPAAHACVAFMSTPPFTQPRLRRRLRTVAGSIDELVELTEVEGQREAQRLADIGVTLARAAGWTAEPLVKRSYGSQGLCLNEIADACGADLIVVGRRGVNGVEAVLGSVSQELTACASAPVLVVPHPLLKHEWDALGNGPVLVGIDGSAGAAAAWQAGERLFAHRDLLPVSVGAGGGDWRTDAVTVYSGHRVIDVGPARRGEAGERSVGRTLCAYADSRGAALLVVGSRGRSAATQVLTGSVARTVMQRARRPVLIVPPSRAGRRR